MDEQLKERTVKLLSNFIDIINDVKKANLQHTQYYIEWMDCMNKLTGEF